MGSLTSRPDIPQVQQPVIFTVPTVAAASVPIQTAPSTTSSTPSSSSVSQNTTPDSVETEGTSHEEAQRLAREDNLLRRSRGRLGTVLTGFSGLLSQTSAPSDRKTLLGE